MEEDNIIELDEWTNAIDSLEFAASIMKKKDALKWKWVLNGVHHCLYSLCIARLRHFGKKAIAGRKNYDSAFVYKNSSGIWRQSEERKIDGAYGFYRIKWNEISEKNAIEKKQKFEKQNFGTKDKNIKKSERHLIGFSTALARVMDNEYWMKGNALYLNDYEIKNIGYIHNIRNLFEHFIYPEIRFNISRILRSLPSLYKSIEYLVFDLDDSPCPDENDMIDRIKSSLNALRIVSDQR